MSDPVKPWVSFCISTYKRPEILGKQLELLSRQTFSNFEVVVSDNDPEASAKAIVEGMKDTRFLYFHNEENLGMIKSFNKSIERATTDYIVMVTDDDPVDTHFLETFHALYLQYRGYSIYCGFLRKGRNESGVELVANDTFLSEILDPGKTSNLLWSSAVIRRKDALTVGLIPDYGSPHLSDHAFMAEVGSINGGIIMNKMFSSLSSHDSNFSKSQMDYYVKGCEGFYNHLVNFLNDHPRCREYHDVIVRHLGKWFISNIFTLKKYYTMTKKDKDMINNVNECATRIVAFPFMSRYRLLYRAKNVVFWFKKTFGRLR